MTRYAYAGIETIAPAPWSTAKRTKRVVERLRSSLECYGQATPLVVRRLPAGAQRTFEVIDGSLRLELLKELGAATVDIVDMEDVGDAEARELHLALNLHGTIRHADSLANVLEQVVEKQPDMEAKGKTEARLVANLPIPARAVSATVAKLRSRGRPTPVAHNSEPVQPWVDFKFKVPYSAGRVIDNALTRVESRTGVKRAQALEFICADFLSGPEQ